MAPMKRAVFLDRDGTLIEDRGYIKTSDNVIFFNQTFDALLKLQNAYELFIITNQSGVSKGLISLDEVKTVNHYILHQLQKKGIQIADIFVCPHAREQQCQCMKPKSFFLEKAAAAFNIDLQNSFSIGDHPCDVELAENVGGTGIYLLTGHGKKHVNELPEHCLIVPDINAAANLILSGKSINQSNPSSVAINHAAELVRNGGVVAFPTETVYGLGANALDDRAVARIFHIKKRPFFDPLIVHVESWQQAQQLVQCIPAEARLLTARFWPGPLTLVLPKSDLVPDIVTSGLPSVGIRMPAHPTARELIFCAETPIAAPSANLFGYVSPTCAAHVVEQLGDQVDCILNGKVCSVGIESTIISFVHHRPTLLRPGGITREQIESVIGPVDIAAQSEQQPLSPGRLERHYATHTPLFLFDTIVTPPAGKRVGLLMFQADGVYSNFAAVEILTTRNCLVEAASNLYAAMRRLESQNLDMIFAVNVPQTGLGIAINDRLRRASQKGGRHLISNSVSNLVDSE